MAQGSLEETEGWLRRAHETLAAAQHLAHHSFRREAVSRAYYAMFYAARALLLARGIIVHKHSAVLAAFGKEFARKAVVDPRLHRAFIDAFKERNQADYLVSAEPQPQIVAERLRVAVEFVRQAEQILDRPASPDSGQG